MRFVRTALEGVVSVEVTPAVDPRGLFARAYDPSEFAAEGLSTELVVTSLSHNARRGTLRGMHLQRAPHEEIKLVRCVRGAIFDVALDLRPGSPTLHQWIGLELTADNRRALYVPRGCAHGFQALTDGAEVLYQMTPTYVPDAATGVRWDDPAFGITWPIAEPTMSPRDATYPLVG